MSKILVVVDMQNDFITGSLGTPEAKNILPKVRDKLNTTDADYIFFTKDSHFPNYLETQEGRKLPIEHCIVHTDGWEIADGLTDVIDNNPAFIITKFAFGSTALLDRIDALYEEDYANFINTEIELCGLCTDICVISNAIMIKNFFPEVEVIVDSSLCAGVTPEKHEAALEVMRSCQITLL